MMVIGTAYIESVFAVFAVFAGDLSMLQHSMNDLDFLISHRLMMEEICVAHFMSLMVDPSKTALLYFTLLK